jgi:DNA-binding NtrC family response regulator
MARRPTLRALAAEYVSLILQETGGDKARAAKILGISRRTLYRWDRQPENRDNVSQTETD